MPGFLTAVPIRSLGGAFWLHLGTAELYEAGVVGATGRVTFVYNVPATNWMVGQAIYWISAAGNPFLRLSNNTGNSFH